MHASYGQDNPFGASLYLQQDYEKDIRESFVQVVVASRASLEDLFGVVDAKGCVTTSTPSLGLLKNDVLQTCGGDRDIHSIKDTRIECCSNSF